MFLFIIYVNPFKSAYMGKKQALTGSHNCEAQEKPWVMLAVGSPTSLAPPSVGLLLKQPGPERVAWAHVQLTACRLGVGVGDGSNKAVLGNNCGVKENQLPNRKWVVLYLKKGNRCRSG